VQVVAMLVQVENTLEYALNAETGRCQRRRWKIEWHVGLVGVQKGIAKVRMRTLPVAVTLSSQDFAWMTPLGPHSMIPHTETLVVVVQTLSTSKGVSLGLFLQMETIYIHQDGMIEFQHDDFGVELMSFVFY
jgi:hypothetical protein